MLSKSISESAKRKLQLYTAAFYLFEAGKSHPQIISILEEVEPDKQMLTSLVDKAMREDWDKLYLEAKRLFSEGLPKDEIVKVISEKESDIEIVAWICGEWYELKLLFMECLNEGRINIFEGIRWIVICALGLVVLFGIQANWVTKSIWIAGLVGAIIQWVLGMEQRKISRKIDMLFTADV
jgi:hypothetical protein